MSESAVYQTSYEHAISLFEEALPDWAFRGINQHPSYHGVITQEEAEEKLGGKFHSCYLTRYDRKISSYMLSVATLTRNDRNFSFKHFLITIVNNEYELQDTGKRFKFISQLLEFYLHNSEEIDGSESSQEDEGTNALLKHTYMYLNKETGNMNYDPYRHSEYKFLTDKSSHTDAIPTWRIQAIGTHPSFHGVMTGEEAETVLKKQCHGGNCFLTRYSEEKSCYRISVKARKNIQHFSIVMEECPEIKYEVQGAQLKFNDIHKLLSFYESTPLTFQVLGIGKCIMREDADQLPQLSQPSSREQSTELKELTPQLAPKDAAEPETSSTKPDRVMVPTLSTLTLVKWEDDTGQERKLKITEKLSAEWQRVGILLGLPMSTLEGYRQKTTDPIQHCTDVFHHWLENSSESNYPPTWKGVYTLLNDLDHGKTAEELKQFLASKQ